MIPHTSLKINPSILTRLLPRLSLLLHQFFVEVQTDVNFCFLHRSSLARSHISCLWILRGSGINFVMIGLHFSNVHQGFFTSHLAEIVLFKLSLWCLTSFSSCAARVAVVVAWRFKHVEIIAFIFGPGSNNLSWSEWAYRVIESVCVKIKSKSICESASWDGKSEIFEKFGCFSSAMGHEMSSIWNFTADNHTNGVIDIEDTSVSAWY